MNLIDRYIQEVIRRLPDKQRSDIALELESTIYDMLPEDYSEENVHEVLTTLGNPAILASEYNDKPMHLIGPKYYDVYISLLKMILPIVICVSLVAIVATKFLSSIESDAILEILITTFSESIWVVINVFIQTFFWLTITFVIIDRADQVKDRSPVSMRFKPWTPKDLHHVVYVPKKKSIKTVELFISLLWTAIWGTAYFYADHLLGIYESSESGLRIVTPAFNQDVLMLFWPLILLLIGAEVALAIYKMIKKQWTRKLALFYTIKESASVIIFIIIINQSNLFTEKFLDQLGQLFSASPITIKNNLVWGSIIIMIISVGIAIFDVYRKANIKGDVNEGMDS